ncbi:MAG: asparagine synthase [Clostridiaceae bacterium]|nr:asparagine synthase [Clostridiaceae bacterium]
MKVREGIIPTALGVAVTITGIALKEVNPKISWGITGFGLAHIILGGIELIQNSSNHMQHVR